MTILKRGTKGSALTYAEMDENIRDLHEDTTINRVLENGSGSGSDAQHLTYTPAQTPPAAHEDPGYITINYGTRLRMATEDENGESFCCENMLDMKNHNIVGVNNISFSDPGPSEGLMWGNVRIWESPDDLSTNTGGDLQVVYKQADDSYARRFTVRNTGVDVVGTITSGDITVGDGNTDATLTVNFSDGSSTAYKGYGVEFNRETCYIRPNSDGNKDLNLGAHDDSKDWRNINIKTTSGTHFTGPVTIPTHTPASASAAGTAGQIAWDADYIYVCTATNTWKRAALTTW